MARKSKEERQREAVIDPALRESEVPSSSRADKNTVESSSTTMSTTSRRQFDTSQSQQAPSPPPPIATIPNSHSPSPSAVSVDRSSNSTPHVRRSPPSSIPAVPMYPTSSYYDRYRQDHPPPPINHHHSGYLYAPPFDPRYDHHPHPHYQHHLPPPDTSGHHYSPSGLPTHYIPAPMTHPPPLQTPVHPSSAANYSHHYPIPGQPSAPIVHTSDANTKLTDGIRRRCFNCCTTDTSTWRRSNLSPGKVLCNKCGLFERTHSRPRPEQFPHKRGALASSNLRGRTPPAGPGSSTQLPPLSAATAGGPYQYHHSPLTPLNVAQSDYAPHMHQQQHSHPNTLPGLQTWHGSNSSVNNNSTATGINGQQQSSNGSANGSSEPTPPALLNRRTLDSPRLNSSSSGGGGGGGGRPPFDDRLSADPHARSHPPTPPLPLSRSSTATAHHLPESHTPPPARDPQA